MLEDLIHSAEIGDVASFEELLTCALPINANGKKGYDALCAAVLKNQREIFDIILEINGLDLNKKCSPSGCTALMIASQLNLCYMMRKLIEKGCAIDNVDDDHTWSALHFAAYSNHVEALRLLIDCGANIELLDSAGQGPLHIACYNGCLDVVKVLVEYDDGKCDLEIIDRDGNKAIDYGESDEMRDLLLREMEKRQVVESESTAVATKEDGDEEEEEEKELLFNSAA